MSARKKDLGSLLRNGVSKREKPFIETKGAPARESGRTSRRKKDLKLVRRTTVFERRKAVEPHEARTPREEAKRRSAPLKEEEGIISSGAQRWSHLRQAKTNRG